MLKLKHQYFGHLMCRANSLEKSLMLVMIEGRRRGGVRWCDGWMASSTLDMSLDKPWVRKWRAGKPVMLHSLGLKKLDMTEWHRNNFCFLTGTLSHKCFFSLIRNVSGYVCELHFPAASNHKRRGSVPLSLLLVPAGVLLPFFCQSHSYYRNGGIFSCVLGLPLWLSW